MMAEYLAHHPRLQRWTLPTIAVLIVVSLLASGLALRGQRDIGRQSRADICTAVNRNRALMRQILADALASAKSFDSTPEKRAADIARLEKAIRLAGGLDCPDLVSP